MKRGGNVATPDAAGPGLEEDAPVAPVNTTHLLEVAADRDAVPSMLNGVQFDALRTRTCPLNREHYKSLVHTVLESRMQDDSGDQQITLQPGDIAATFNGMRRGNEKNTCLSLDFWAVNDDDE